MLQTYPTKGGAYATGALYLVTIIDHETAAQALEAAALAEQEVPAAHNRVRVSARTKAIDAIVNDAARYADKDAAAAHIAGQQVDYLHRHTVNLGCSRRYSDYRADYERRMDGSIVLHGTASKTGKSIDRISIAYTILVID